MLVCFACFIWAITTTVQVFTVYPLSWLFAYQFFQFPWWVGRELRAKALLARKRACTPVLNSFCRSRALGSEGLMPSPWLHWALLIACLPQENLHGPKPLTLKQPGWSWDSIVSSPTALVYCVLWAYPELLTPRFWWQLCGSDIPWVTQICEIQTVQCPQRTSECLSTRDLPLGSCSFPSPLRVFRAAGASVDVFLPWNFFIHLFPSLKWKLFSVELSFWAPSAHWISWSPSSCCYFQL